MEESACIDLSIKNFNYQLEKLGVDVKSSTKLIYDVLMQGIYDQYDLVLPQLSKLAEILDNKEQFQCIKDVSLLLYERIPQEDTINHQYVIYLLLKSAAVVVPSINESTHLATIVSTYLKSTQLFIRNATLSGLLSLLESLLLNNTKIAGLSSELLELKDIVVNYVSKHGIVDECPPTVSSDLHTKLVWTMTFYIIESTSKFLPDCSTLISNTIISANNFLKRTTNLDLYLCIVHGLNRLVLTTDLEKSILDRIEKLAIELVKRDNELFSSPALELLLSCMYIGSSEQLVKTEESNGVVQDEPEIVMQSTEKLELILTKIRSSTPESAESIGQVLGHIVKDLLPPNEILTKVVKEFLTINQPYPIIMAKITFQVFRSAIDSSFLPLLQDWLICSLHSFLTFPIVEQSLWYMAVIFVSVSCNQHLIGIFPEILNLYGTQKNQEHLSYLFSVSIHDFCTKLNSTQQERFNEALFMHKNGKFILKTILKEDM